MAEPIYETRRLLDEYLLFHYGSAEEVLPWRFGPQDALEFPARTVRELLDESLLPASPRALDLGCAVGRSSFELARYAHSVVGIDYSHSFVQAANDLLTHGQLPYHATTEGSASVQLIAHAPQYPSAGSITFQQGDAMELHPGLADFHIVHAANLLCRLPQPMRLIQRLPALIAPGGQLLLTTPCSWLAEFTPPENWPTGSTQSWLKTHLNQHFTLAAEADMPFLIREHARKYQWTVAWASRWVRK